MKPLILLSASVLLFAACNSTQQSKSRGPIRLGDSATIVTETDPQYLHDLVPDIEPIVTTDTAASAAATPAAPDDTAANTSPATPAATPAPTGNGLAIAFKDVTLFIPGITAKSFTKADLTRANSASYQLATGKLAGNTLQVSGSSTITKVTQRYQTTLALQGDDGDVLPLAPLGTFSSPWQPLGSKGSYSLGSLAPASLEHPNATPAAIRNAVSSAARAQHLSRQEVQDWQAVAKQARSIGQPPVTVVLKNVTWRVEGKDATGHTLHKEVRIDLP